METLFDLLLGNTLTRLVFFPAAACLPLLFFPRHAERAVKIYTLIVSLVELAFGLQYLFTHLQADGTFPRLCDGRFSWIPSLGISYALVMDGISMPLAMLGIFLVPIVILGSWKGLDRHWPAFGAAM